MKTGIENLKNVLAYGFSGFKTYGKVTKDGKVNLLDLVHVLPMVKNASSAFNGIKHLKAELLDIDDTEQAEIIAFTKEYYANLNDQQCVQLIEETVEWVIDGVQLGVKIAHINKDQVAA